MLRHLWHYNVFLGACFLVAACRPDQSTATAPATGVITPSPIIVTATPLPVRPTLLPTWTRTPTRTPLPTPTPTMTPSPPATLTSDQVCSAFIIIAAPLENAQFDFTGTASFAWQGVPANTTLVITIGLKNATSSSQPGIRVEVPFEGDGVFPVPLMRLPTNEGQYEWKIWLQHPDYGTICTHSGTFLRRPAVPILL